MIVRVFDVGNDQELLCGEYVSFTMVSDGEIHYYLRKVRTGAEYASVRLPGHADK